MKCVDLNPKLQVVVIFLEKKLQIVLKDMAIEMLSDVL